MKMKKLLFLFIGCLVAHSSVKAMGNDIFQATKAGVVDLVRALLLAGADPNQTDVNNDTPLIHAVTYHHPEVLQALIDSGRANANQPDQDGNTPLMTACEDASPAAIQCAQILIAAHADVNLPEFQTHRFPLSDAVIFSSPAVVRALLDADADPNQLDSRGMNSLHWACQYKDRQDIIQMLVDAGVHVNLQASAKANNITPLHTAANWSELQTVRFLLAAGADVNLKDGRGKTPLDWARNRPEVFNLIKRVKDYPRVAKDQLLALLGAGHSRLGAESPAQPAFHAHSEAARLIAPFIRKYAFEDALDGHNK